MNDSHETPTIASRRATIAHAAVTTFATTGYYATTVADVARAAGYSPAYVFRLFTDKLGLFVAAIDRCYQRILMTLREAATDADGIDVLDAMGIRYAELIADRNLLTLQAHAQSASSIPEVRDAIRRGYHSIVELALLHAGGDAARVQLFIARGLLCQLIVMTDLPSVREPWSDVLTDGFRHP